MIKIEGLQEEGKSFCECKCCRIEVIAPVQLRRTLGLEDGDPVEIILL